MRPLRVLIDLDEVAYGWNGRLDSQLNEWRIFDGVPRLPDRTKWELFDELTPEQAALMAWILNDPHYYAKLELLPGVVEAVAHLEALGYDVYFVSTVYPSSEFCASDKLAAVERDFGKHLRQRTILTDDKTLIIGDVLIDDRPVIEGAEDATWVRIVFDQPYNQGVAGVRLSGWAIEDLERALEEALA